MANLTLARKSPNPVAVWLIAALVVSGLLLATFAVIRLGFADYLSRQDSLADRSYAAQLVPGNADFVERVIDLRERKAENIHADLLRFAQVRAEDPYAWLNVGIDSQFRGNDPEAEQELLQAARLSRQYEPRWELAKYYYRQRNGIECDRWLAEALRVGTADPAPAFRMSLRQGWTSDRVLSLVPDSERMYTTYLNWLVSMHQLDAAKPVADRLMREYTRTAVNPVLAYCDQLTAGGPDQAETAVVVWNELATARGAGNEKIFPAAPVRIVNGNFATASSQLAFDWKPYPVSGVTSFFTAPGLMFSFLGDEPEQFSFVRQLVSVKPATRYTLRYTSQSVGLAQDSGVAWHAFDSRTHKELTGAPVWIDDAHEQRSISFQVPDNCRLVELILTYQRQLGTARPTGTLTLKSVEIQPS